MTMWSSQFDVYSLLTHKAGRVFLVCDAITIIPIEEEPNQQTL